MAERRILAWSVQAFIVSKRFTVKKRGKARADSAPKMQRDNSSAGKIVVYRGYFVRLLSVPKPLRDQLLIELPCLQALRTGEVSSLKVGRAYFAVFEHYVLGKPLAYVQFMLRHDNLQSTEHYVCSKIVCYEDQKALFFQGKRSPFSLSKCVNSTGCLGAMPDCHCRMFQPQMQEGILKNE